MKSKRFFGYSSQEYEEEDLAYDTPERKKKQKGGGRSGNKVVRNGTFFLFLLRVWFKNWINFYAQMIQRRLLRMRIKTVEDF